MLFPPCQLDLMPLADLSPVTEYDPPSGQPLWRAAERLCAHATVEGRAWAMVFNGRRVVAQPGEDPETICARWSDGRYL